MAFLPELILVAGALALFAVSLGDGRVRLARAVSLGLAIALLGAVVVTLGERATLFSGAYRVDAFSQWLKLAFAAGYLLILLVGAQLPDIREDVKPEYFLLLSCSVLGLMMLVSAEELMTLVIALELASFPLFFLVPMRREREHQRVQMESAAKYVMFGITATGIMLFGMSYIFGVTGSTSLPVILKRVQPLADSTLVMVGLAMMFAGVLYKLAVFPFHFWSPDVYQGASNETASLIASLPKLGAVAVLLRFVALATHENPALAYLLACLAAASMFYGNLVALQQSDLKRLLGFSGIAHAGYALLGFVALDAAGFTAAVYYLLSYLFMVLACFIVICRVSVDGVNVRLEDLAGLHRRSPLLAATLVVGIFALAGIPPFAGFMGKLMLLKSALNGGFLVLVILAVVNAAIAVYYYLGVIREACFRDPEGRPAIVLDWPTRAACLALIAATVLLGVFPGPVLDHLSAAVTKICGVAPAAHMLWAATP